MSLLGSSPTANAVWCHNKRSCAKPPGLKGTTEDNMRIGKSTVRKPDPGGARHWAHPPSSLYGEIRVTTELAPVVAQGYDEHDKDHNGGKRLMRNSRQSAWYFTMQMSQRCGTTSAGQHLKEALPHCRDRQERGLEAQEKGGEEPQQGTLLEGAKNLMVYFSSHILFWFNTHPFIPPILGVSSI